MTYTVYTDASIRRIDALRCKFGLASVIFDPAGGKTTHTWVKAKTEAGDESNLAELLAIEHAVDTVLAKHRHNADSVHLRLYTDSTMVLVFFDRLALYESGLSFTPGKTKSQKYIAHLVRVKKKLSSFASWQMEKQVEVEEHAESYLEVHVLSRQACDLSTEIAEHPTAWELSMYPWVKDAFKKGELIL